MAASQHMARYGTTRETLGWIALNARANAALNPTAVYRDPLTMDDYLGRPPDQLAIRPARLRSRCATARSPWSSRRSMPRPTCPVPRCGSRRSGCRSPSGWSGTRACSATSRRCSDRPPTSGPARRCARRMSTWPSSTTASPSTASRGSKHSASARSARPRTSSTAASTSRATASCRSTPTGGSCRTGARTAWASCTKRSHSSAATAVRGRCAMRRSPW